jgi:uncharacterized repeat protein (TIGR03803 family)
MTMNQRWSEIVGGFSKRLSRRQKAPTPAVVDLLEPRRLLSGSLATIAAFSGTNGQAPLAGVADAHGNLFGVTSYGAGSDGLSGEVFEVPAGTSTIKVLAPLPADSEGASLIIDSSGNIYGTQNGNISQSTPATVFEIAAGGSTLTTLATFPTASQQIGSQGKVTAVDSAGDVFGVTFVGNAFEIVKGSGVITPLMAVNQQGLQFGPDGNLYGLDNLAIIQVSPTTHAVTTLGSIDPNAIGTAPTGITLDSSGNIWGFCQYGGSASGGSVFELPAGSNTVSLVGSFTSATGTTPICAPAFDASGSLYGLTEAGGANGYGTLFQIPAGKASAGPVDSFDLTPSQDVTSTAGMVTNSAGIVPTLTVAGNQGIPFFGSLFSATATATTSEIHPDDSAEGVGAFIIWYPIVILSLHNPPEDLTPKLDSAESTDKSETTQFNTDAKSGGASAQIKRQTAQTPVALLRGEHATPDKKLSAPLQAIKTMLTTVGRELKPATTLVHKETALTAQFNKEGKTITKLGSQLATQTKASTKAKLQKQLSAAQAVQAKYLNQDNAVYNTANTDLTNISTLETEIQTALNAL